MLRTAGRRSALFLLVALLVPGIATAVAPAPVPAGQPAAADKEWPRTIRLGEAKLVLDAPRAESLEGTVLKARGGAQLERPGKPEPLVGTVWYQAEIAVDRSHRTVTLVSVQIPRVQLAGVPPARAQQIATKLGEQLTRAGWKLSLDEVLASARLASRHDEVPAKLGTAPPKILFAMSPTVLVLFDGEPKFRAVPDTGLERAMNTAFLVLRDPKANLCYLDGGTGWFRADTPTGPWEKAGSVPDDAKQIARKDRQEAGIPETAVDEAAKGSGKQEVRFLVSNEPAELIVSDGPPKWTPLVEGELETIANSENDLFRTTKDGNLWIVLSGRWYRASSPEGPWSYVEADRVPPPFRLIPADSPKASVLAFIPGTAPAREAIKDASTPRTAAVRRSDAHVTVTYDGEPKFEGIPGTHVEYALNTAEEVLKVRGRYYVCDQGVWFVGKTPQGPWAVADEVPEDEIQGIPPESPVYNTRFVTVYDSTPDTVYVAYTPAYVGSYFWGGTVVYGTGWYYRPWWGAAYYPRPWTWGFGAFYRPWAGWGWGFGWGGWPGWRFGFGLGWGAHWCGPAGFYRPAYAANVTRNVTVNRTVNVTRNVYSQGANATRATTPQSAAAKANATKPAGQTAKAGKAQQGKSAQGKGQGKGTKPNASKPGGGKAAPHAGAPKQGH